MSDEMSLTVTMSRSLQKLAIKIVCVSEMSIILGRFRNSGYNLQGTSLIIEAARRENMHRMNKFNNWK